jgi:hypothetical protein
MSPGPNNRRYSTYEPAQPAELPLWALFAHKMPPNFWEAGHGLIRVGSACFIAANLDGKLRQSRNAGYSISQTVSA